MEEKAPVPERYDLGPQRSQGLADILDRVLDKGLIIAGDIRIRLADVELLTVQIRLLICSVDKADEIGLNWWRSDPHLTAGESDGLDASNDSTDALASISEKLDRLEQRLSELEQKRLT